MNVHVSDELMGNNEIYCLFLTDFGSFWPFLLFRLIQSYKDSSFANIMRPNSLSIML